MESPARQISLVPPPDRRQSETALAIARGTARMLRTLGFSCISELPLPSGRRADLVALNEKSEIWIIEIKSSIEDLRADQKWQDYRMHCDRLFFAFTQDLPCEIFPEGTGLIIADAYGAHLHCEAPEHRLPAPTRKLMTVRFAMAAAQRINRLVDPQGHAEFSGFIRSIAGAQTKFAAISTPVSRFSDRRPALRPICRSHKTPCRSCGRDGRRRPFPSAMARRDTSGR